MLPELHFWGSIIEMPQQVCCQRQSSFRRSTLLEKTNLMLKCKVLQHPTQGGIQENGFSNKASRLTLQTNLLYFINYFCILGYK